MDLNSVNTLIFNTFNKMSHRPAILCQFYLRKWKILNITASFINGRINVVKSRHTLCQLGSRLDTSCTQEMYTNERNLVECRRVRTVSLFSYDWEQLALRCRVIRYSKNVGYNYLINGQPTTNLPPTSLSIVPLA